jgi:hypothetical protein
MLWKVDNSLYRRVLAHVEVASPVKLGFVRSPIKN